MWDFLTESPRRGRSWSLGDTYNGYKHATEMRAWLPLAISVASRIQVIQIWDFSVTEAPNTSNNVHRRFFSSVLEEFWIRCLDLL